MTKIDNQTLFSFLDKHYPDAHCELVFNRDYELLISVVLSAQTTDKAVNKATKILFADFPTLEDLKNADVNAIAKDISSIGMSNVKAKNLKGLATMLVDECNSRVPNDPEKLLDLPGVGNKTKNCVLAELFNMPLLAVDTHVQRISKRLGIVSEKDSVEVMEKKLVAFIPKKRLIHTNHQIIDFGRDACKAKNPNCKNCELSMFCKEKSKNC